MTNNHPDQIDEQISEILNKYAAYCDQWNREFEYDTSDNIDTAQAHAAMKVLMLEARNEGARQFAELLKEGARQTVTVNIMDGLEVYNRTIEAELQALQGTEGEL